MFNMKKSLGSLGSLDTKNTWFHLLIGIVILMILSVGIRRDIREFLNSGVGRVLMLVVLYMAFLNYGIVAAGLVGVLFVIVVMNDTMREGMENKDNDGDDGESKDEDNDDDTDTDTEDTDNDNDNDNDNNTDNDDIEQTTANNNNKGTSDQLDNERAMQISGDVNSSNSEETVKQMNEEKKQHDEQDKNGTKEGFVPMGNMIKSMYSMV